MYWKLLYWQCLVGSVVSTDGVEVDDAVVGQLTVLFAILLSRSQYTSTHPDSTTTIPMTSPAIFKKIVCLSV